MNNWGEVAHTSIIQLSKNSKPLQVPWMLSMGNVTKLLRKVWPWFPYFQKEFGPNYFSPINIPKQHYLFETLVISPSISNDQLFPNEAMC
jgi:hypothetical protein